MRVRYPKIWGNNIFLGESKILDRTIHFIPTRGQQPFFSNAVYLLVVYLFVDRC